IYVRRVFERQRVEERAGFLVHPEQRELVEDADRPRMTVEELAEIRLPEPAVDAGAHLDTDLIRHRDRSIPASGEIDLPESALSAQSFDSIAKSRFRADHDFRGGQKQFGPMRRTECVRR